MMFVPDLMQVLAPFMAPKRIRVMLHINDPARPKVAPLVGRLLHCPDVQRHARDDAARNARRP